MTRKSILVAIPLAILFASPAMSVVILENGVNATITSRPIDDAGFTATEDVGVVYDSLAFEGNVQTPTTGPGGQIVEDYVSTISTPSTLEVFNFVGGVDTIDHVVHFNFFDTSNQFVDGFAVRLPSSSLTSIWTITLNDPTSVSVPAAGFLQMLADDGTNNAGNVPTNAAWRFKDVAPAIGSTQGDVYRMTMTVIPEPSSACLLGLAVMMLGGMIRRRR